MKKNTTTTEVKEEKVTDTKAKKVKSTATESEENLFQAKIDSWKKEYGKIYQNVSNDNLIIWRTITRKDYKDVMQSQTEELDTTDLIYNREEKIVKKAVLYPSSEILDKYIDEMAGFATVLSENILDKSGFKLSPTTEL